MNLKTNLRGLEPASKAERFERYVSNPDFPCVGARSALNRGRMEFGTYGRFVDPSSVAALRADLAAFSQSYPDPAADPVSFVALFDEVVADEAAFEAKLWQHLQALHEVDRATSAWAAGVSADPASNDFSFSVAGRAFFVVGLAPVSSRLSRRAPFPCLVFNFHEQFETLKATGKYSGMQRAVRARDLKLQGSINPVLARFGESSEARQYSGRSVNTEWKCPFQHGAAGTAARAA